MEYNQVLSLMTQEYKTLSGFDVNEASDIGIRFKVLATQIVSLLDKFEALQKQVYAPSSTGIYLDRHAQLRGLVRKKACAATGIVKFSRETSASYDIVIPAGIVCSTAGEPSVRFETSLETILPAGSLSVDVPLKATDLGSIGNVAAGAVCVMVTTASGISSIYNPSPFSGGINEESDLDLRARLDESYINISNGTNSAFYFDEAMKHDGISSVNVLPRSRGRGTVDIVVTNMSDPPEDDVISSLNTILEYKKEINVDVLVRPAARKVVNTSLQIAPCDGVSFDELVLTVSEKIRNFLSAIPVGKRLLLASLGREVLNTNGVYNYRFSIPFDDISVSEAEVISPGTITINRLSV